MVFKWTSSSKVLQNSHFQWRIRKRRSETSIVFRKTVSSFISFYIFIYILYISLLFFAVYVTYKKNYSFSRVVFVFFYLTKTANSSYSKINDSSRVRTTAFSSSRYGVRVTARPKIFYDLSLAFFDTRN